MRQFSELMDRLVLTPSRNGKLVMIRDYFAAAPDPDRGWCLAALTGRLDLPGIKPALLRTLIMERIDPELFRHSYDFVGDLAETISLIWPEPEERRHNQLNPSLADVIGQLLQVSRSDAAGLMVDLLDRLTPPERYALIKLVTGGLRIGVSSALAKQALADLGSVDVTLIEEIWHGIEPPFAELFAWLDGKAAKPAPDMALLFRPVMLAQPLDRDECDRLDLADFAIEWKWDGIRVQVVGNGTESRLYSRSGDDITRAFPDVLAAVNFNGVLDGELLVRRPDGQVGTFGDLQQRLNRKTVSKKMLAESPAFVRIYDVLFADGIDQRGFAWMTRRQTLERLSAGFDPLRLDLSPLVEAAHWEALETMRHAPPHPVIEGVMLKRKDSLYIAGRPKGPWFKWKADPYNVDAVLMYAQRGHGKRSSFYSDYTFGVWKDVDGQPALVPVGKAYSGFTDDELRRIDKYVRDNTIDRFGPVRSVRAEAEYGIVFEIAFEGLNRSPRHKSGVAMRFPRIARIRWDKLPSQADRIETLEALLDQTPPDEGT